MTSDIAHPSRPAGWEHDIYPMPAFPTLAVADPAASADWYQKTLGFVDVYTFRRNDGRPLLVHLRWAKWADLLLVPESSPATGARGGGVVLTFLEMNVDALAERIRASGTSVVGPTNTPWNTRDVSVVDPDGYSLRFTSPQPQMLAGKGGSIDDLARRLGESDGGRRAIPHQ